MSFSKEIKDELNKIIIKDDKIKKSELAGFMIANCTIGKEEENYSLKMSSESETTIRRIYSNFKNYYGITAKSNIEKAIYKSEILFKLKIENNKDLKKIFDDSFFGIDEKLQIVICDKEFIKTSDELKRAFLRGVFIGSGSCVNPSSRYHLEIVCTNHENALFVCSILNDFGIVNKILNRKKYYIIYLKDAESISTFLAVIGANSGTLKFEETRVYKEMRNNVNRISNFENANFDKTINASLVELEDIKLIRYYRRFEKLPSHLKEVAKIRLSYKEATLEEIGNMLEPKLSRAGVSHRFKSIHKIAEDIKKEKGLNG